MQIITDSFQDLKILADCKTIIVDKIVEFKRRVDAETRRIEIARAEINIKPEMGLTDLIAAADRLTQNKVTAPAQPVVNIRTRKIDVVEITDFDKIPHRYFSDPRLTEILKSVVKPDLAAGKKVPGCILIKKEINY
jgi:hypothetical protein